MLFNDTIITISTCVKQGSPAIETQITLTGGEVPDSIVQAAFECTTSPRVRWQSAARRNGIPTSQELT